MAKTKIQALDNGPFLVEGDLDLLDGAGNHIKEADQMYLCRCGLSTNMPFCTGAHEGKFKSEVRAE